MNEATYNKYRRTPRPLIALALLVAGLALALLLVLALRDALDPLARALRTLGRRIAAGRYRIYGEGNGKRILYSSILDDIRRECGEVL